MTTEKQVIALMHKNIESGDAGSRRVDRLEGALELLLKEIVREMKEGGMNADHIETSLQCTLEEVLEGVEA